jgi:hypothetical protein
MFWAATMSRSTGGLLRLVTGVLVEISEEWETGKIYLQPETKIQHTKPTKSLQPSNLR